MITATDQAFTRVAPGLHRRADGFEIRRMKGGDVRKLFRGAVWCTGTVWLAYDADGKPICSRYPAYVGGATLPKAIESLTRHERRIAQVAA